MRPILTYRFYPAIVLGFILFFSCEPDAPFLEEEPSEEVPLLTIPEGFPEMPFPEDNAFTKERWELGKKLFYDKILSRDQSVSCGTCHQPAMAFSDGLPTSFGIEDRPGTRNAPSLANVGYQPFFLREGSVPTLEMQVLVPIQEENEFDHNILDIADLLLDDPEYVEMSMEAYDRLPDAFVITRAIGVFQRTLISGNSPYDQYEFQGDINALNASEKRGKELFFGEKTNCSSCHGGFNFTNYGFENNGLYETYSDPGRKRHTGLEEDDALFKIPSLRNVELTAPYMFDGSVSSLEAVVEHYNSGGANHPNKNPLISPLGLTKKEKEDLVNFLKSLTDRQFIENSNFHP